jgi:phosphoglycerol transferase MdoB-like AlkP superfamily enzyme
MPNNYLVNKSYISRIVLISLAYMLILLYYRVMIIHHIRSENNDEFNLIKLILSAIARSGEDNLVVFILTMISLVVAIFNEKASLYFHAIVISFVAICSAINVDTMLFFGGTATLSLIRYAGLTDWRAIYAITDYIDRETVFRMSLVPIALIVTFWIYRLQSVNMVGSYLGSRFAIFSIYAIFFVSPFLLLVPISDYTSNIKQNAAWNIVKYSLAAEDLLSSGGDRQGFHDPFLTRKSSEEAISSLGSISQNTIKNVIVIVLESVGQTHLDELGENVLMPSLFELRDQRAEFGNAYASIPSSPVALFTLMSGVYPPPQIDTMPSVNPRLPISSLVSELSKNGLRTGFFLADNWDYSGYLDFLTYQGANHIEDASGRKSCSSITTGDPLGHAKISRDECTLNSMKNWIASSKDPFFALFWNDETHYPYVADGETVYQRNDIKAAKDRYVRAIQRTDGLFGGLVNWLKSQKIYEETLIVLVGDHGQAFGQHGSATHGSQVYEEAVKVPLMFVNPRLFNGVRRNDVVGQIDVAPTIMEALGFRPPAAWQGLSLFGSDVRECQFFAAPWFKITLGYRCGAQKFIYQVSENLPMLFDLNSDPQELKNLISSEDHKVANDNSARLVDWKKSADAWYKKYSE